MYLSFNSSSSRCPSSSATVKYHVLSRRSSPSPSSVAVRARVPRPAFIDISALSSTVPVIMSRIAVWGSQQGKEGTRRLVKMNAVWLATIAPLVLGSLMVYAGIRMYKKESKMIR